MKRCSMLVCLLALGACQEGLEPAPEALGETVQALDCTPGGNFCNTPTPQIAPWQGQLPPIAGQGQSYHAYRDPANQNEMILALADLNQGKIVWAVHTKDPKEQRALLGITWDRGPVDVVRPPPPPPPPTGTPKYIMERAIRFQELHAEAFQAVQQCGP